jgi:hypothetical protein
MNVWKSCSLLVMSIALLGLTISASQGSQDRAADGSSPIPTPPVKLVADGSSPVPTPPGVRLVADGSSPIPTPPGMRQLLAA